MSPTHDGFPGRLPCVPGHDILSLLESHLPCLHLLRRILKVHLHLLGSVHDWVSLQLCLYPNLCAHISLLCQFRKLEFGRILKHIFCDIPASDQMAHEVVDSLCVVRPARLHSSLDWSAPSRTGTLIVRRDNGVPQSRVLNAHVVVCDVFERADAESLACISVFVSTECLLEDIDDVSLHCVLSWCQPGP